MINRSIAPELKAIDHIEFIAPKKYELGLGANMYHMKEVPNETSRFDLYFDAGKCRGEKGIPSFVNGLLLSGTADKTSIQINEQINSLGGFLESGISVENSVISMYCLRENLLPIFNVLMDAIKNVAFIEKEVDEFLADRKQQLKISEQKVSYLAQRNFQEKLFASESSYAKSLKEEDFADITIDKLKEFHNAHYLHGLTKVVVVGDLDEKQIAEIVSESKNMVCSSTPEFSVSLKNESTQNHISKEGALQSAIRVGKIMFNKDQKDYTDFLVLNTILGDYFGSRLMSNIREDKGYTYGIGTMLAELNNTGYFLIATEVGAEVKDATIAEIKKEIELLQAELVSQEELELVRNYMLGQLLKNADGPYAMTDLFLSVELHGKTLDFYNKTLERIQNITPHEIRAIAQKHLNWDSMTIVSAG